MMGKFGTTFGTENSKPGTVSYFQVNDGWNRLVKIERGASNDDRRINQYNGLKKKGAKDQGVEGEKNAVWGRRSRSIGARG